MRLSALIVFLLGLTASGTICNAQTEPAGAVTPSPFAPIETPTLDPSVLKPPSPAHDDSTAVLNPEKTNKNAPDLKLPNRIDLGKSALEFEAGRTSDINPRTGLDSGETANMQKIRPGKTEGIAPNYFGLKLTAPTH